MINWAWLANFFSSLINSVAIKWLTTTLMTAIGIGTGFWGTVVGWIVSWFVTKGATEIETIAKDAANNADQKEVDTTNINTLITDKQSGASETTVIQDETNVLNGTVPTKKD